MQFLRVRHIRNVVAADLDFRPIAAWVHLKIIALGVISMAVPA
jgi:hypothetical protein